MEDIKINDLLNWANDKEILAIINGEKLLYSDIITKVNHYGMAQERSIILTDINQKTFTELRRHKTVNDFRRHKEKKSPNRLSFGEMRGVTYSKLTYEFVIHGNDVEYDYQYLSQERNLIICLVAIFYQKATGHPLKICEVQEKTLKNYVTGKKEKKKDNSYSKMDEKFIIDTNDFINQNKKEISNSSKGGDTGKKKEEIQFFLNTKQ